MQELLKVIVAGLVEDPTAIQITEDAPNEEAKTGCRSLSPVLH